MKRATGLAVALAVGTSGCSWLFQERLPGGYAAYNSSTVPRCTRTRAWAGLDTLFAISSIVGGIAASQEEVLENGSVITKTNAAPILGGILGLIVHGGSAISGFGWASDCSQAFDAYDRSDQPISTDEQRELADLQKQRDREEKAKLIEASKPRGFYCTTSPTQPQVNACARDKAACEQVRGALVTAAPDVTACVLVEAAHCFDAGSGNVEERCSTTGEACLVQRDGVTTSNPSAAVGACAERK